MDGNLIVVVKNGQGTYQAAEPAGAPYEKVKLNGWYTLTKNLSVSCLLCPSLLRKGDYVYARTTRNQLPPYTVYMHKKCIESILANSPLDNYDKIKRNLDEGKGLFSD